MINIMLCPTHVLFSILILVMFQHGEMPRSKYSDALISLIGRMLSESAVGRPNADEILQSPAIRNYVSRLVLPDIPHCSVHVVV